MEANRRTVVFHQRMKSLPDDFGAQDLGEVVNAIADGATYWDEAAQPEPNDASTATTKPHVAPRCPALPHVAP